MNIAKKTDTTKAQDRLVEIIQKTFYDYGYGGSPTVCPECHVDDFIHVEGCSFVGKELDLVIAKEIFKEFIHIDEVHCGKFIHINELPKEKIVPKPYRIAATGHISESDTNKAEGFNQCLTEIKKLKPLQQPQVCKMKFYCKHCKKIITRDMRVKTNRKGMSKRGYRSLCTKTGRMVYLKPLHGSGD